MTVTQSVKLSFEIIADVLYLKGSLTLNPLNRSGKELLRTIKQYPRKIIEINLAGLKQIDSSGVAYIRHIERILEKKKSHVNLTGASAKTKNILATFTPSSKIKLAERIRIPFFEKVGNRVYIFFTRFILDFIYLIADVLFWTFTDFFHSKEHRKGEFINQSVLIGVNALPIVGLISFLIGLVLALQSASQLRQFGANVFIVDLTVIAMTREMGPLLTAIMIAGRSGSAITSEIATMVVTEEVDALKTMALNPIRYIVVPKVHASLFTMPFLTIMADILGIIGGMVVGYLYLDINLQVFANRMVGVLQFWDILTGLIKSIIFAVLIVLTASFFGFRVKGGAEGVGKYTTAAVVTSIFLVILADSILGLLFY